MANKKQYAVHEDFKHYPAFPFPFNGFLVGALNKFLHLDTFFRQRKVKAKAKLHSVTVSDATQIDVFQFNPDNVAAGEKLPAIIYFHGGAFVLTYASTHVEAMDYYANQAHCAVFMVDYRLAPANLFPKGFNDCFDVSKWVEANAESLGVDASRIAVMGDSAGGTFSAGIAQRALDEGGPALVGQVLVYPALDSSCSTMTAKEYEGAPMFDAVANRKMWEVYLKGYTGDAPVYAAPADRENLSQLPTAYIENAEFDPLRDEATDYAKRLQAAGVDVVFHETLGTVHGYDTVLNSDITQDSLKKRIEFLKDIFS